MPISHRLVIIATWQIPRPIFNYWSPKPPTQLPRADFSKNLIISSLDQREGSHQSEVDRMNIVKIFYLEAPDRTEWLAHTRKVSNPAQQSSGGDY